MDKNDIKRAYHEARNARMKLENVLSEAPAAVRMEYRDKYRKDNPNRVYRVTSGKRTNRRKPTARTPRLDALRVAIAHCNVTAAMIRRGVAT